MRVALIHAPSAVDLFPNLGIGQLAAVLQRAGHALRVFDYPLRPARLGAFVDELPAWSPDLVGFSTTSFSDLDALGHAAATLTARVPRSRLVVGGPLPTLLRRGVFDHLAAGLDHVFVGEAERTLLLFLERLPDSGPLPPGVIERGAACVADAESRPLVEDLDSLPYPVYPAAERLADYPVISSRGCAHNCSFCLSPHLSGRAVRVRSPEHFVGEVAHARARYAFRRLQIVDDNFLADRTRAAEILEQLARRAPGLRIELSNGVRGDTIDAPLAALMKRAGVRRVCLGVESLDERVFDQIGKGERLPAVLAAIDQLRRAGIEVQAFMIIGLPGATEASEAECVRRARALGVRASWLNALAFPQTRLHRWARQHAATLEEDAVNLTNHWSPQHRISFATDEFNAPARRRAFIRANIATGSFDFVCHGAGMIERLINGTSHVLRERPAALPSFVGWCLRALVREMDMSVGPPPARGQAWPRPAALVGGWLRSARALRDRIAIHASFRGILDTPPTPCQPAAAEVHSMICHQHVLPYLLAVKSLLRFHRDLAIVAHDDGTLEDADVATLRAHLPGARIISSGFADAAVDELLRGHPACRRYRRDVLTGRQLFDFFLLARGERVISLDADVIFLDRPAELVQWLDDGGDETLLFFEPRPGTLQRLLEEVELPSSFVPMGLALACFRSSLLDLALLERVIPRIKTHDWWTTQNIFPLLVAAAAARHPLRFLSPTAYQDVPRFGPAPVLRHYWTSLGVRAAYRRDARATIRALQRSG